MIDKHISEKEFLKDIFVDKDIFIDKDSFTENDIVDKQFDIGNIFDMLLKHGLLATAYHQVFEKKLADKLFGNWSKKAYDITCQVAIDSVSKRSDLVRILKAAEEQNIKFVLFKGSVIADTYPYWVTRTSSDADIYVYQRDAEAAVHMLEQLGYIKSEKDSKEQVPVFIHSKRNHVVELHFSLWEDYEGDTIELLDGLGITEESSLEEYQIDGVIAWTLGYTEHLIFQMFHIIKHFIVQGIGIKYMVDVRYFYGAHKEKIDHRRFWDAMSLLHYDEFCRLYFKLAIDIFGADSGIMDGMQISDSVDVEEKCCKLFDDMWEYVNKEDHDYSIITLMSPYLEGRVDDSAVNSDKGLHRKLQLIFPKAETLQDDFWYAKKHHFLLPIAWVHKWFRFIFNRISGKSSSGVKKLKDADKRIEMIKEMKLNG